MAGTTTAGTGPTGKFSGKAVVYDEFRPGYPPELLRYLADAAGLAPDALVADIGAGTGIFSQELAGAGFRVIAVEPNADMLAQARARLHGADGPHPVRLVQAAAERTGLAPASVDLVTAAQAFHWFDRPAFKRECARILKPGGRVALIWNSRVPDDPANRAAEALNRALCPAFKGFSGGAGSDPAAFADFFEGPVDARLFDHDLPYDEDSFIGRNLSASYAPRPGDDAHAAYVAGLRAIFHRYADDGILTMRNVTRLYLGRVSAEGGAGGGSGPAAPAPSVPSPETGAAGSGAGRGGVAIRRMRLDDYETVHALWLSCPGMGLNDVDDARDRIGRLLDRNPTTCLVACVDGDVVGVILAGTDGRRAYVYHTAVRASHQGRGIGRALVEAELEAIRALGISKVALVVFKRNAAGNAFWERMGFTLREDIAYRNRALRELVRIDT